MNVMNVMNIWKSATFMPQAHETKGRLNVMNVVQRFFARGARTLPTGSPCLGVSVVNQLFGFAGNDFDAN